jgi:hypothetical protein
LPANKWQRAFYRRTTEGGWARTRIEEHHTAILMPAKQFNGRVGEFLKVAYKLSMLKLQERAVGPLMLEAIDRHHFNDGENDAFSCPVHGCSAFFSRAGEWTDHAIERHFNMYDLLNVVSYLKQWRAGGQNDILSEELRVGFEQRTIDLHNRRNELEGQTFRYAVDWVSADEEGRNGIKREWMEQLETDPLWATESDGENNEVWSAFADFVEDFRCYAEEW